MRQYKSCVVPNGVDRAGFLLIKKDVSFMRYYTAISKFLGIGLALAAFLVGPKADAKSHNFHHRTHAHRSVHHHRHVPDANGNRVIGGSPHGCPRVAFCGCALAQRIFGVPQRDLWLASNWFRFRKASPAENMVAVRQHHVFQLIAQVRGNTWLVWDPNSGHHRTRVHQRSIAGYVIVNPHSSRFANL